MSQQWSLPMEFLKSDMDRINNPDYFMKDFECNDLLHFFSQIITMQDINKNRESINMFYDYFLAMNDLDRNLYVQIKWILVLHQVIQGLRQNSPIYGYMLKALQLCVERVSVFEHHQKPFQNYLMFNLVKPYLQYLCKLCLLNMPSQTLKFDENSALSLSTKPEDDRAEENEQTKEERQQKAESLHVRLIDWYRRYNFTSATLNTFQTILQEVRGFFAATFPFLNNIGTLIVQDLNNIIFRLKYSYRSLKKSNVTLIELDQLDGHLKSFSAKNIQRGCLKFDQTSIVSQFGKNDLKQFLQSPMKPSQLRLYTKKSIGTPLSALVKQC